MVYVFRFTVPALLVLATALPGQSLFPLKDVRPGMHGVGRTVFSGNRIEEFQVEILGVLENTGPHESIILGRLSGGPLAETGVMQGMSGSPVYIDGKLVGAVALAYAFSKEPIAGIRPIEDMIRPVATRAAISAPRALIALGPNELLRSFPQPALAMGTGAQMIDIATPLSFGGFTRAALDAFAPQLRSLGLEPRQAVSSAGKLRQGACPGKHDQNSGYNTEIERFYSDCGDHKAKLAQENFPPARLLSPPRAPKPLPESDPPPTSDSHAAPPRPLPEGAVVRMPPRLPRNIS